MAKQTQHAPDASMTVWQVQQALAALRDLTRGGQVTERGDITVNGEAISALFDLLSDALERTLN